MNREVKIMKCPICKEEIDRKSMELHLHAWHKYGSVMAVILKLDGKI